MIPKFRAWDKKRNEMFKDTFAVTESGQVIVVEQESVFNSPDYIFTDDLIVMQSTGVIDKNGKEVFEGDIVKTERLALRASGLTRAKAIGTVKNLEGAWVIDTGNTAVCLWDETEENEVIGNIYENPELI